MGTASAYPGELGLGKTLTTQQAACALSPELAELPDEFSPGRYDDRMGTGTRDWVDRDAQDAPLRLAREAGLRALGAAGIEPETVVATVVSTCTPPYITKSFAAQVALSIGNSGMSLDLRAGGAGGLEAWALGAQFAASGQGPVLVIAVETASRYANPSDMSNALLFGDGAAALVLGEGDPHQGLAVARSSVRPGPGEPFSVPGALPPTASALGRGDYVFQRPTPEYLSALEAVWIDVTVALAGDIAESATARSAALPYAVTRSQLDRFGEQSGLDTAPARHQLRTRGCLGVAGPLALAADHLTSWGSESALAAAAVGGGISTSSLLWLL